ncbi:MAG: porin family protein [Syntrophaceae bacterium]|nr:porin family protein [Syntrophaceae bacterium]
MKKIANYIFVFTLIVFFAVYPFKSASAETGLYIGGWGGFTIDPDASEDDWDDYYDDVNLDINETSVWGVKVGYSNPFFRYLALEAEYSYLNPDVKDSHDIDGDVKISSLMFNVIGKYSHGIIQPYFGIGFGFSYSDMSLEDIRGFSGDDYTSYAWQLLTGVELYLTSQMAVDIGYRYYITEMEFEHDVSEDVTFSTSILTLGLKLFF